MADNKDEIVFDGPEGKPPASNGAGSEDLDDSVIAEEYQGDMVKKLKERLKEAEAKAKEYLGELQRAKADFVNMRKRDEEDKMEFVKFAKSDVLGELIPVLDALNLGMSHPDSKTASATGLVAIHKQLSAALKKHGLEELDPMGETFDPRFHEAVGSVETDKKDEDHKIVEVMQKGYILSGKIIRPAKVKITNYNG